ncbi:PTS sugar transporter subunit IIA [Paraburkholderia gardini]|uniref:PTS sugar transporter subunit IIA n=1 Tax=Paraburkholderia gardini TaxID=2823469 RepID=A0ABN7QP67_9BURK|nr:PTS sugar transporter subunit IIA [Paraburkholderia gardini]CAG4889187.1 hypothetical protein R69919_00679 [Paraburkholderia gardini]CAG4914489.1 hypothetical protein R54767_04106 [Paraburkholderia gardini]
MVNSLMAVLEPEAIVLQSEAKTNEEIILILARELERLGYVKPGFANAVIERERSLPTGLKMEGEGNVAVPHTDPCHVLKAGVAMATLKNPVAFANMEDPEESVSVDVVFLLAINDKDKQIETLQTIIATIQDASAIRALKCARTLEEVKSVFGQWSGTKMARIKTILFACGTGVATSTAVNVAVTEEMKKRGLTFNAQQAKATEVLSLADNVDFIVATTPISASVTKPVIKGLAFLTGIGKDKVLDEIEAALRK